MAMTKVTVTIERELLEQLDQQVASRVFANRSKGVQIALRSKSLAEEAIGLDLAKWPEY